MWGKFKRLATHAGSWYPAKPKELDQKLEEYLNRALNDIKSSKQNTSKVRVIIAPHAGLQYSGPTAAYVYCQINNNNYKRVILLGPSHYVFLDSCALTMCGEYQTPLGNIKIDQDLNKSLLKEGHFKQMSLEIDEKEHSLEMHLPFIKKVFKQNDIKLLPILVGSLTREKQKQYGKILSKYLKDDSNLFIVSSDFCHWGQRFDYVFVKDPTQKDISSQIKALDQEGISKILAHDPDSFCDYLEETDNTICGKHPIAIILEAIKECKELKLKSELVKYDQSQKIEDPLHDSSVSYASIITKSEI